MKRSSLLVILTALLYAANSSCGNSPGNGTTQIQYPDTTAKADTPSIKTAEVIYTSNGKQSNGYIAYDENRKEKMPVIVVIPEWWGLTDYPKSRARQLAALGYFAIAADLFGDGKTATNPKEAMAFTKP